MDGHTAEWFSTAANIRDDESVRNRLFRCGVHVAGASQSVTCNIAYRYGSGNSAEHVAKIFGHIDWHYAHNLYTGMEKGLGQPAGDATDVKSFSFICRCGIWTGAGGAYPHCGRTSTAAGGH